MALDGPLLRRSASRHNDSGVVPRQTSLKQTNAIVEGKVLSTAKPPALAASFEPPARYAPFAGKLPENSRTSAVKQSGDFFVAESWATPGLCFEKPLAADGVVAESTHRLELNAVHRVR
jgi:hypothetical protein